MALRLLRGDMRETLARVAPGSVQTTICSPPYYGLRSYGTPPLVWGGDPEHAHTWGPAVVRPYGGGAQGATGDRATRTFTATGSDHYAFCLCGAWLGHLGLEPTPEAFVEHIVECFRAVRRVLRDDGTVWCNLGDSYAGSGKGPTGHNGIGDQSERQGFANGTGMYWCPDCNITRHISVLKSGCPQCGETMVPTEARRGWDKSDSNRGSQNYALVNAGKPPVGLKAKDLMMMPSRVAMALQADGWYLRAQIPWLKRCAMPESVVDRPSSSVEYVFLLSKSARYFYDPDAVRAPLADISTQQRMNYERSGKSASPAPKGLDPMANTGGPTNLDRYGAGSRGASINPAGRNRRNGDWFFESWQGMLLDDDGDPLALVVNPAPYKDAHYATFPPKLVEPMIKASTSERGCCAECGAPWARVRKPTESYADQLAKANDRGDWYPRVDTVEKRADGTKHGKLEGGITADYVTAGWQPTCKHSGTPVPQTVLDCFAGANTTLLVADRLGRNGIGCELSEGYADMGSARLVGDAPMFVDLDGWNGATGGGEPVTDKRGSA